MYKFQYSFLVFSIMLLLQVGIFPAKVIAQGNTKQHARNVVQDLHGNPIANVNIEIWGKAVSVKSQIDGTFNLEVAEGDKLVFTHPRYLTIEAAITQRDVTRGLLVRMPIEQVKRSATIVGPYGEIQDEDSNIGSISTVYSNQLSSNLSTTLLPSLTGRMQGLNIIQNRGTRSHHTTANYSTSLSGNVPVFGRGVYSDNSEFSVGLRGMSPVVLVDGVQREFYALDPDAIESVSVQKDALSSMFLGMQSARGALIITTKTPTKGPLQVSLTGRFGVNSPLKMPKPLDSYQYAYLLNEALENDGKLPYYANSDFSNFRNNTNPYTHPDVNWFDELFKENSVSQYYNLNVSGGNDVARYYISLGYMNEEGLFTTSPLNSYNTNLNYQRYLITSKVNVNVTRDFTADIMLLGRIETGNQPGGTGSGYSDLLNAIYTTPNAAYPIRNPNDSWGGNVSFTNNLMSQTINSGYLKDDARDVIGTLNLKYDFNRIVRGLSVNAIGSITTQTRFMTDRTKRSAVYDYTIKDDNEPVYTMYSTPSPQVNRFVSISNYQDMYGQVAVNYDRQFGSHRIKTSVKGDTRTRISNFDLPEVPSNIMANAAYDFAHKYFVQAAVTESYYNRYAPGMRWGNFYAFGLGWDISKERFMESLQSINQLKVRAVHGLTGNGITNSGYYIWSQTYTYHGASWYPQGTTQSNGNFTTENHPLANPYITWEKAKKTNVGVDISIFRNRIKLTADYYNDHYSDLLQTRGKSIELLGASYPVENIGKVNRKGLELNLSYQESIGRLNFYVTGNWTQEQNKILFMDEQELPFDYQYKTGRPVGTMFGLIADGFLTADDIANGYPVMQGFSNIKPGDVKYKDMNDDGIIDEFDAKVIGGDKPLSYFGLDYGLEYKGLEFSMLWQGVYNRDIYLGNRDFTEGFLNRNQHYGQAYEHLLNRWTPENAENAEFPRLTAGGNNYNQGNGWGSSMWIKSGNFMRLKNLTVAYTIPADIARTYLGNLRIKFFVSGQNLFTMAAYGLLDPEVPFNNYPMQRNINFGVNVKF